MNGKNEHKVGERLRWVVIGNWPTPRHAMVAKLPFPISTHYLYKAPPKICTAKNTN